MAKRSVEDLSSKLLSQLVGGYMVNFAAHSAEPVHTRQHQVDSIAARITSEHYSPCIYAGSTQGLYVLDGEQRLELEGNSITALAVSSKHTSEEPEDIELWAIVDRQSVWHRASESEWFPIGSGYQRRLNCLLSIDQTILIGTSEAHLMQIKDGNIQPLNSFDQAEGREAWYTPWGGAPDVRSLAANSSGDLYVNVHVGGILRSLDQGRSWQPTLDLHADVHEVITLADYPNLVLAATAEGLAWSEDYGESWQFDRAHLHATYARAISVCHGKHHDSDGATLLMSSSLGPRGEKAAIYRRPLHQSGNFEKCHQGLPEWFSDNINTGCLSSFGSWVAFGTETGQIFCSNNAGLTWELLASGLAPIRCLSLAFPKL